MTMTRVASMVGLIILGLVPEASGQMQDPQVPTVTCPFADSMAGPAQRLRGSVWGGLDTITHSVILSSGRLGASHSQLFLHGSLQYTGAGPIRLPRVLLHLFVPDDRRLERALFLSDTITAKLELDDSLTLNLGSPVRSPVTAPPGFHGMGLNLDLTPATFAALARSRKGRFLIGPSALSIGRDDLEDLNALYRVAVCVPADSLPRR